MPASSAVRSRLRRWRGPLSIALSLLVAAALASLIAGRRHEFATALHSASAWVLVAVAALQVVALVSRTEAWNVCVRAAGGTLSRRRLHRAASMGYLTSLANGQVAVAARVAMLRRDAPRESPCVSALVTAELPILSVEAILAAVASFTLVGPLGLPWWVPLLILSAIAAIVYGLTSLAGRGRRELWKGLAVMRSVNGRWRVIGLVMIAVLAQIARNYIVLQALGVNASVFDSVAVLIAMVVLSQLPVGPSVGAAAAVIVLGADGVAAVAAAGVLLTATGTAGSLAYTAWSVADRLWARSPKPRLALERMRSAVDTAGAMRLAFAAVPV